MKKKDWSFEKRYELITRNSQEIIGKDELIKLLKSDKKISVYWGTMPTGSISIAYFFPMIKIADFLKAGLKVKILLADLHAALDSVPWNILEKRYDYYKKAITKILEILGVNTSELEFVKGSDYQLKPEYNYDLLRLSTLTSLHDSKKAASEAVKSAMGENDKLSGHIYPLMQALDEQYLNVDIQYAGLDQRKIMVYARENLPKIGYQRRIELMTPMIRGLVGEKMSSSVEGTKIDLLDDEKKIQKRINKADCIEGNPDNGIMAILKYFIFLTKEEKKGNFVVKRPEKFGGNMQYENYEQVEKDFISKKLHPLDLKNAVADELISILKPFRQDKEMLKLHKLAYK